MNPPHREYTDYSERVYWAATHAGNRDNATTCVVRAKFGWKIVDFEFTWPAERLAIEKLENALSIAFSRGSEVAKREIRNALGIEEPR